MQAGKRYNHTLETFTEFKILFNFFGNMHQAIKDFFFNKVIIFFTLLISAIFLILPIFPFNFEIICSAFVALTEPDGFAEGAAIGVFASFRID